MMYIFSLNNVPGAGCHRQLGHVSICFLIVLLTHFYFRDVEQHFSQHLL